jgi:uncharacterized protein
MDIFQIIAGELAASTHQVSAAVKLLDDGATVPFIARYRKEATQGLDDTQLRTLEQRLIYLRELNERRNVILESIKSQGKLTTDLEQAITQVDSKTLLKIYIYPTNPSVAPKHKLPEKLGLNL